MATRLSSRLLIHLPAPTAAAVPTTSPRLRKTAAALTASYRRHRPRLAVLAGAAPSGGAVAPAAPAGENRGAGLTPAEAQRLEEFLKADLPHLFDDVGIDRSAYDDRVRFRDPITRYDDIDGYLANIRLLKVIFRPDFYLHDVKQDIWDSIQNNEYFSFEGLVEVFKQLRYYKTPDIETPSYLVLKKAANYEVRKYPPFAVAEAKGEKLTGSSGFNNVTGYIFGKNASSEKIAMTTPVFTQASDDKLSDVSIQIALPMNKDLNSLPAPNTEAVTLRKVEGGIAAVKIFSGRPEEEIVAKKEKELRSQLLKDGLKPQQGCMLARYNDPSTKDFVKRNEVLIWLNDFTLE
ncbi:uncharacterized protein [Triticum aestivum]|uniref:uncharacterized protein isoform X2 n=1 Tax=Triticum aestivum TaxID=4565 RepID=UPI001D015254|nr:uncharacterized protein LOC123168402 isoform X2 [Triticum aestivum]